MMRREYKKCVLSLAAAAAASVTLGGSAAQAAPAGWDAFIIRSTPTINENYNGDPDQVQFIVNGGGTKAALATGALDGSKVGDITQLKIDRIDDYTRFQPNEGAYYAPFMNIWVQDADGDYAIIANEPSNAEWTGTSEWNTSGANLATKTVKVFEAEPTFNYPAGVVPLGGGLTNGTFADFANYTIKAPTPAELSAGWVGLGSGAPRELGTNVAYGFNWVFGDTGANYVSDGTGFIVGSPAAVPEPTGLGLIALGGITLLGRRARRQPVSSK